MNEEESLLSADLEESINSEASSNSDEKAMHQFLDELRKYRQKIKKKAKETKQSKSSNKGTKDQNAHQSTKTKGNSEVVKKKRKRHKLFDPHPPPKDIPKDNESNNEPKKKLSRKECKSLIDRLTKSKDDKETNNKKHDRASTKQNNDDQKNSQIFTNLYNQSIEAEKKRKEMKETQNKDEEEQLKIWAQPKTCRQSKVYAHNRMIQYVNEAFGEDKICSEKKLLDILQVLGLAENKRKIVSLQHFSDESDEEEEENGGDNTEAKDKNSQSSQSKTQTYEDNSANLKATFGNGSVCKVNQLLYILQRLDLIQITKKTELPQEQSSELSDSQRDNIESEDEDQTMYTVSNLKKFYLEVANDQITRQFHAIAKKKLLIAMANEKRPTKIDYEPNKQFTTAQALTRQTLDRLVSPKKQPPPDIYNELHKDEEYIPIKLSEGSKKILNESTRKAEDDQLLCSLPINEREKHLMKKKNEKIEQMKQEFQSQLTQGRILSNPFPQYDEETTQMLAKYKEDKKNYVEPQPSYRPTITKYEDFVKMQEELNSTEIKLPRGWDEDISRHRKAHDKFIHFKRLKTEGIDYMIECRINARAQIKETNQKGNTNRASDKSSNANQKINLNKNTNQNINPNKEKENINDMKTESTKNLNMSIEDEVPHTEKSMEKSQNQKEEINDEHVQFYFQNNESDDADMED